MPKKLYQYIKNFLSKKEIDRLLEVNDYLDNFNYNLPVNSENKNKKSNYIWQLWLQGESQAPPLVKICLNSIKKYHPEKEIIILDKNNIKQYLEIPKFIEDKYINGIISNTHFSDYIRTSLLDKYGGIWIDSTVLLTNKIPERILNQDFFVFKNPIWYINKKIPTENIFKIFLSIDKSSGLYGSNWFIVANANNYIIKLQKYLLEQYWKKENYLIHYFLYHFFISKSLIKNEICEEIFDNMYSLSNKEPHILQAFLNKKYDENLYNEIVNLSNIHKLTYKYKSVQQKSFLEYILNKEQI